MPWRRAGVANALVAAALALNAHAGAQNESAPPGPGETPAPEETESEDAAEPSPAADSQVHPKGERLGDIVLPAAPAGDNSGDENPLDHLEPWDGGGFLYPYPPAKGSLPPPEPSVPAPEDTEEELETRQRWYGWQTLILDGASITAVGLAAMTDHDATRERLVLTAAFGYFLGPPIVHWANGQVGRGFGSLALRAGSAAILYVGVSNFKPLDNDDATPALLILAGLAGLITAIPVDAAVLARKDEPRGQRAQAPAELELASITPVVDVANRWLGLTAVGRF